MAEEKKSNRDRFRERYAKRYPDVNMDDEEAYYDRANSLMDEYEGYENNSRQMREQLAKSPAFAEMMVAARGQEDFDPVVWMVQNRGLDLQALQDDPDYAKKLADAHNNYLEKRAKQDDIEKQMEANMPQTQHYKFQSDKEMTYYIQDETLYVTYDGGETFQEVPDGYEKVCKETNDTYDELLDDNSYIVTEEFTGFIGYTDQGTELIYSEDKGGTWQESLITENGYKAASFLSRQNGVCYVTFATDRALGSDYYGSWWSEDLNTWTYITTGDMLLSNLTCVYWASDGTGYYARGELLYRMAGREGGLEELTWPEAVEVTESLGFNPFDSIDRFYEEDGVLYMVVGQGSDGDYVKDGKLSEALYQSADGVTFTFVKEIADDTPEEAG